MLRNIDRNIRGVKVTRSSRVPLTGFTLVGHDRACSATYKSCAPPSLVVLALVTQPCPFMTQCFMLESGAMLGFFLADGSKVLMQSEGMH